MAHLIRVNAGQKNISLSNGKVYDGPVDVTLTDEQYDALRSTLFPSILTNLGPVADIALSDLPPEVATDAEVAAAVAAGGGGGGVVLGGIDIIEAYFQFSVSATMASSSPPITELWADTVGNTLPSWASIDAGTLQLTVAGVYFISGHLQLGAIDGGSLRMATSLTVDDSAYNRTFARLVQPVTLGTWTNPPGPTLPVWQPSTYVEWVPWVSWLPAGARVYPSVQNAIAESATTPVVVNGEVRVNRLA